MKRLALLALGLGLALWIWNASAFRPTDGGEAPAPERAMSAPIKDPDGCLTPAARGPDARDEIAGAALASGAAQDASSASEPMSVESNWVVIEARTPEGEPFRSLATALGSPHSTQFAGAFRVWESEDEPANPLLAPADVTERGDGRFQERSDGSQPLERIGVFRRDHGRGSWLALFFNRRFLGWQFAAPRARAVSFTLTLDDLRASSGSLSVRVVDASARAPLANAKVSLHGSSATSSLFNWSETPDAQGRVEFAPIAPSDYSLSVSAEGASEYRALITIEPAQHLDLGDVALGVARPIHIVTRDSEGRPVSALVEVGSYRRGAKLHALLSPRAWATDGKGELEIPAPAGALILRATEIEPSRGFRLVPLQMSPIALVEPPSVPDRIELVIGPPTTLEVDERLPAAQDDEVRVEDDLGIVWEHVPLGGGFSTQVPRGRYRVTLFGRNGNEIASRDIEAQSAPIQLVLP